MVRLKRRCMVKSLTTKPANACVLNSFDPAGHARLSRSTRPPRRLLPWIERHPETRLQAAITISRDILSRPLSPTEEACSSRSNNAAEGRRFTGKAGETGVRRGIGTTPWPKCTEGGIFNKLSSPASKRRTRGVGRTCRYSQRETDIGNPRIQK